LAIRFSLVKGLSSLERAIVRIVITTA